MSIQTEQVLETQLVTQLQKLGYELAHLPDETALIANLKHQLEKHNQCTFSKTEFERVMNLLSKGSIFEKAQRLRQKQHIVRDDNSTDLYFDFFNTKYWCQNQYQVTHQVSQKGVYDNRYDVTLLINGLPLVQIELKRRGLELQEAFRQINRYQKHSFGAGAALFQYIQIFVISNGVNTKYFSNFGNTSPDFMQTFYWTDPDNKRLTNILHEFTDVFLEPCHISKMISQYIVLYEGRRSLMVLRPYQVYAVEAIENQVKTNMNNGYIWHTTGSGKTLTSFKASQILVHRPEIQKVVFVVDRKDLDAQTSQEFNRYSEGSVSSATHTLDLIKKFQDPDPKNRLIVTTIQKLNYAIDSKHASKMKDLENTRMIFIFDECHRSQFGRTHQNIIRFFKNIQLFGFTGTPILAENAAGEQTTASLFGKQLHKYVITDAIRDENVLKFSVEYIRTFKPKATMDDVAVAGIDPNEVFHSLEHKRKVMEYILANHARKTHDRKFTAILCTSGVLSAIQYYELFQEQKRLCKHDLKIATIFSYGNNEEELDLDSTDTPSFVEERSTDYGAMKPHSRNKLEEFVGHFNLVFNTAHSLQDTQSFYNYSDDISKRVRNKEIDILLVANMFLTGFDSPNLNTLYVDKNLQYHGLIQAFSRTNRINGKLKTQGNIVCFRPLKPKTDEAITLFSNREAVDVIVMQPYETYVRDFGGAVEQLLIAAPTVHSVNELESEIEELAFVKAFRDVLRLKTKMEHFTDFQWSDLPMDEQLFLDYASKYQDLREKVKRATLKEKVSILQDIDFETELIQRDDINVAYIIDLLIKLKGKQGKERQESELHIANLLNTETSLRSKRELIEKFMQDHWFWITDAEDVRTEFDKFWATEQQKAFEQIVVAENLSAPKTQQLIDEYLFAERKPLQDEIIALLQGKKPSLLQRKNLAAQITKKIMDFVETFIE